MTTQLTFDEEVVQRLRRIETKLHKWGIKVGLEPAATTMTLSVEEHRDRVIVYVPGYDVTLSQIRRALEAKDVDAAKEDRPIFVVQGEALLGILRLTGRR